MTGTMINSTATTWFASLAERWNAADGEGYGALFADDATFTDIRGGRHVGRQAIAAGHQGIFDTAYAGSVVRYEVRSVRMLIDGIAVAVADATLEVPAGPLAGAHDARTTVVLEDGLGVAFHNTLVTA
jgi:uncharacterized protein (TIGR02246 family)